MQANWKTTVLKRAGARTTDLIAGLHLLFLRAMNPRASLLIRNGTGLGDALLAFGVAHEFRKAYGPPILATQFPELAKNNPDIFAHVPAITARRVGKFLFPGRIAYLSYPENGNSHIGVEMCRQAGLHNVNEVLPRIYLSDEEYSLGKKLTSGHLCLQVDSDSEWTPNKQWSIERMVRISKRLASKIPVAIIGRRKRFHLDGVLDLRGMLTVRETAAVLQSARLFVGMEGGLMHLARAVGCKGIIIVGGRVGPWQTCYDTNVNLYTRLECSPCWKREPCPYKLLCLDEISENSVLSTILQSLSNV